MKTVEITDAVVQYRRATALAGITAAVADGEHISLFGPAGSGKTTLLRVIAGRVLPTQGCVRVLQRSPRSVASKIGFTAERTSASSLFSPNQALAKSLSAHDIPGYQRAARIAEALELLGLHDHRDRPVRELGQVHRTCLGIAASLVHRPAVLLLDNITTSLPGPTASRLWKYLDDRRAVDGLSVIHATTASDEAERADRVILLEEGRALADDSPSALQAEYGREMVLIEAADPDAVQRTLRGIFDVVMEETPEGLRVSAADTVPIVAYLFRHPAGGFRSVFIRRPTLWDVLNTISNTPYPKS